MAYDSVRERMVVFGGRVAYSGWEGGVEHWPSGTWEWNGGSWFDVATPHGPSARLGHGMVYDAARGRVVLFGGTDRDWGTLGDTWQWDGAAWSEAMPAQGPSPRERHAMAYDAARGRVVLFGGSDPVGRPLGDTWEWDGTTWAEIPSAQAPSTRTDHAMVYDAVRQRIVLFGGRRADGLLSDTWEWDGVSWTLAIPAQSPSVRYGHAMAHDPVRRRVVLFGGAFARGVLSSETWEWDGSTWTLATPAHSPPAVQGHEMAYDAGRQRVVLFGGADEIVGGAYDRWRDALWEWDGARWSKATPAQSPPARGDHAMAYDAARERVVLFGGLDWTPDALDDTWEWDGRSWARVMPTRSPPARWGHAMAYDAAHQRVVMFGGRDQIGRTLGDTWEWDGVTWTQAKPFANPPRGYRHGMAYDAARKRIVLSGGVGNISSSLDTWEWDGVSWRQITSVPSPPWMFNPTLAFDAVRERVVLFGYSPDYVQNVSVPSTWEWDGAAWTEAMPTQSPSSQAIHSMAYDAARQRVILFGGLGSAGARGQLEMWEWDGVDWTLAATCQSPSARLRHAMAYDEARQELVLFGGDAGNFLSGWPLTSLSIPLSDTWMHRPLCPGSFSTFGAGCHGSVGVPTLSAAPGELPRIGETFEIRLASMPASVSNIPFGVLGLSRIAWGNVALPQKLDHLGLSGCTQYASGDFFAVLQNNSGSASWKLAMPGSPSLLGLPFYVQGLVLDPGANPGGVIVTNAGQGLVGAR